MNNNTSTITARTLTGRTQGFTLVELMVAMVVGLLIVGGAFSLHIGSRDTQIANEAQMDMVADARFAIELITQDLRSAGMWGRTSADSLIDCRDTDPDGPCTPTSTGDTPPSPMSGDCRPAWYYDLVPVFAHDGDVTGNPYAATCISDSEGYVAGTDILEIKYADAFPPTALLGNQAYIRSNAVNGRIFIGTVPPKLEARDDHKMTDNFELNAVAYYISNHTDNAGDGIPSLRRVSLVNSPGLQNQLLASGVVDLQVQFGIDTDGDKTVDRYVNPNQVGTREDWMTRVYSAKIWLLMRTDKQMDGVDTEKTFTMAGVSDTYGGQDDYRYFMVSDVVSLRNLVLANR